MFLAILIPIIISGVLGTLSSLATKKLFGSEWRDWHGLMWLILAVFVTTTSTTATAYYTHESLLAATISAALSLSVFSYMHWKTQFSNPI